MDRIENGTCVLERAALATCVSTSANPTGVEKPCIGVVVGYLVSQHASVAHGMQGEEWLSEARRESCLRFGNTLLGAGHLRSVAGDEVEHGLFGVEFGDGRKDATSIAGKENNVAGMVGANTWNLGVINVFDGIRAICLSKHKVRANAELHQTYHRVFSVKVASS